jgi:arginine/lysine/ornithine decarboxylase
MTRILNTIVFATCSLLAASAFAADVDCAAQATTKKLAGAAKASFMKKCEKDAAAAAPNAACLKMAADKHLAGAAKSSFMKKCEADAAPAKS